MLPVLPQSYSHDDLHQQLNGFSLLTCHFVSDLHCMNLNALLSPGSIAIIGASNDTSKPGGKVLQNMLTHGFKGNLYAVNPNGQPVQGVPCFARVEDLPQVDLAIIAIAASLVEEVLETLARDKQCKAFILFSAGFSETGPEGKALEQRCVGIARRYEALLIGPNCIGLITGSYKGVFAGPIPEYDAQGCDCVSASGATMVYLLETAIPRGLKFRDIFSIGNSAMIGVEDVLQYWDETFDPQRSSKIKLLYMEQISDPSRFLKHARSLVKKGCRIAAIKSGATEAGSRAVSSHTGALAGSNTAVSSLFRKAGIIRCNSRLELVYVAAIFSIQQLRGNRIAVITHAGGPGVMLTDILIRGGMKVPALQGPKADALLAQLHPGSSVSNPIDFLATGNARQLGAILDAVEHDFDEIDGAVVVFGTTGMWRVDDVYRVLHEKINTCKKPIFPILPSVIQASEEVSHFQSMGHVNFTDEVSFGYVLARIQKIEGPFDDPELPVIDYQNIRDIIDHADQGYLDSEKVMALLDACGIARVQEHQPGNAEKLQAALHQTGFPVVMKVIGPLHKSDVGGVKLNIRSSEDALTAFEQLMQIEGATGVLVQPQLHGTEVFIGAKREGNFGHQILCGLGGILVEVFRDLSYAIAPVGKKEALTMIRHLKSYPLIRGIRGSEGVNEYQLVNALVALSALLHAAPEISELDINPLLGNSQSLIAVDARICIDKQ